MLYIRLLGDDADQAAAEAETYLKENTICRYYDEVALKALAIGDADARRGALDHERALKIKDSTVALIQNLSEVRPRRASGREAVRTGDPRGERAVHRWPRAAGRGRRAAAGQPAWKRPM